MRCWCGYLSGLEQGADCLHMVQLMPLHPKTPSPLASFKSRLVLPFWYPGYLGKEAVNGCNSSSEETLYVSHAVHKFYEFFCFNRIPW